MYMYGMKQLTYSNVHCAYMHHAPLFVFCNKIPHIKTYICTTCLRHWETNFHCGKNFFLCGKRNSQKNIKWRWRRLVSSTVFDTKISLICCKNAKHLHTGNWLLFYRKKHFKRHVCSQTNTFIMATRANNILQVSTHLSNQLIKYSFGTTWMATV